MNYSGQFSRANYTKKAQELHWHGDYTVNRVYCTVITRNNTLELQRKNHGDYTEKTDLNYTIILGHITLELQRKNHGDYTENLG